METLVTKSCKKVAQNFYCEYCDYYTCKKSSYDKHNKTKKHLVTFRDKFSNFRDEKVAQNTCFQCEKCNKTYFSRNGLWSHKQKCMGFKNKTEKTDDDTDIVTLLINDNKELRNLLVEQSRENGELKNMMMEVIKNGTHNTTNNNNTNNTNTNCHNKSFNLNFFLNETCKNAMNINEFIESIKIQLADLIKFGEVGYVEGITNIINNNLKALDITQRPVHCTDKKRETIYIKENDKWEKEGNNKSKIRKVIKNIASKNYKLLPQYREKYPGCQFADSKYADQYNKLVIEALGGNGDTDVIKEDKIIKNISKNILVDKNY